MFTSVISATFASSTTPISSSEIQEDLFGKLFSYELLGTGLFSPEFADGMQITSPAVANMHNAGQYAQRTIEDTLMQTLCLQFGEQEFTTMFSAIDLNASGELAIKLAHEACNLASDLMMQTPQEYYIVMLLLHYLDIEDRILTPPKLPQPFQ